MIADNLGIDGCVLLMFPISRDPHKGGTPGLEVGMRGVVLFLLGFQFLGIPTKGELYPH